MSLLIDTSFLWNETVWNPSMITTALWLDAADSSTVTTVSGAVSQWNDKSGNARHATQATSANRRPAYTTAAQNNLNAITFTAADTHWLALPDSTNPATGSAVFAACKPNHTTVSMGIINRAYNWGSWYLTSTNTGTDLRYNIGRTGVDEASAVTTGLTGTYDNVNVRVSANGGTFTSTSYTPNPVYNSSDATTIGAFRSTGNAIAGAMNGPIYEIIVLHTAPSQPVIDKMQGYLAHKWGLGANLPSDHPYKTVGPKP
jgi:hypothetical protein